MLNKTLVLLIALFGISQANAAITVNYPDYARIMRESRNNDPYSGFTSELSDNMMKGAKLGAMFGEMTRKKEMEELQIQMMQEKLRMMRKNSGYYDQIDNNASRAKTVRVRGYFKKNGTYVYSHYRSKPIKKNNKRNY